MGADMLIQSLGLKAKERWQLDEEWVKSAFAKAKRAIGEINKARLADINLEPGTPHKDVKSCKRTLLNDLAEVEMAVMGGHRQATTIEGGGGILLLLTGGLSWGDAPTELFASMTRLLEADVIPDARWPD